MARMQMPKNLSRKLEKSIQTKRNVYINKEPKSQGQQSTNIQLNSSQRSELQFF